MRFFTGFTLLVTPFATGSFASPGANKLISRAADPASKEYAVWPADGTNNGQLTTTEKFIKTVTKSTSVYSYRDVDKALVLWKVNATDSQISQIKANAGVHQVDENVDVAAPNTAVPLSSAAGRLSDPAATMAKRDIQYTTQLKPSQSELVMVSQPSTVPNLDDLENYVYEKNGGAGQYIYHVELGINAAKTNEFPPGQVEFLQSPESSNAGQDPRTDGSYNRPDQPTAEYHSTATASKATGQQYGAAKKATLVVVKMSRMSLTETATIFDFVLQDILSKKRQKHSVVTASWGGRSVTDPNYPNLHENRIRINIGKLLTNDVIVVVAAGNYAKFTDPSTGDLRKTVDTYPSVFKTANYPLIPVSATDFTGTPADFAQGGDLVTIWAPGVKITAQNRYSDTPLITEGTSFSAPLVAGVLANYLAYESVPFDTSDGKVAASAHNYLGNKANWQRQNSIKTIWNEVEEKENPKKGPQQCVGNQIQGSCVQGSEPQAPPYSGGLNEPVCNKDDIGQSPLLMFNSDAAKIAATEYCAALANNKVLLDGKASPPNPYIAAGAAERNGDLALSVLFDLSGCPPDKSASVLDFTKMTPKDCFDNFYTTLSGVCAQNPPSDPQHPLLGGVWANGCGLFSMNGQV